MKKLILFMSVIFTVIACQTPQAEKQPIGFDISEEGAERMLYGGSMSTVEVWKSYIKAHNENDLEAIRSLNADSIKIWGPRGELIKGTNAHIEFLSNWFSANAPSWDSNYFIANAYTDQSGALREWVTSGHDVTLTVEGNKIKVNQVHDALISDGKVQMFYVYERAEPVSAK
jgi:uncharacterized protein YacL (UPF0231 family)